MNQVAARFQHVNNHRRFRRQATQNSPLHIHHKERFSRHKPGQRNVISVDRDSPTAFNRHFRERYTTITSRKVQTETFKGNVIDIIISNMRIIDSNAYNIFGIPSPTEQASKFFLFRTRIVRQQSINGMTIPQKFSSKIFTVTNRIPNKMNVINYIGTRILCRIFIDDNIVLENRTCIQILCNTFQSSIDKPGKPVKFLPVRQEITATCILCRFLRNRNPHSI